jgi:hypothetical protein
MASILPLGYYSVATKETRVCWVGLTWSAHVMLIVAGNGVAQVLGFMGLEGLVLNTLLG